MYWFVGGEKTEEENVSIESGVGGYRGKKEGIGGAHAQGGGWQGDLYVRRNSSEKRGERKLVLIKDLPN